MIGSFGNIIFETSRNRTSTYDEMTTTKAAKWAVSEVIGQKPHAQFLGAGQDSNSFKMFFHRWLGVDPETELQKLNDASDQGLIAPLILGGKPKGTRKARWYISQIISTELIRDKDGSLESVEVELDLMEYH